MTINLGGTAGVVLFVGAVIVALIVGRLVRRKLFGKPFAVGDQIALIEEEAEQTAIGTISAAALLIVGGAAVMLFTGSTTILQQIAADDLDRLDAEQSRKSLHPCERQFGVATRELADRLRMEVFAGIHRVQALGDVVIIPVELLLEFVDSVRIGLRR